MKKAAILISAMALIAAPAFAQDGVQQAAEEAAAAIVEAPQEPEPVVKPIYWTNTLQVDLGVNNTQLKNWAAGGFNTTTLSAAVDAKANYAKDLMSWNNRLQLNYGFIYSEDKPVTQKNNDRLYLESKWAYKTGGEKSQWQYTASFDFLSQFSDSYNYNTPTVGSGVDGAIVKQDWIDARSLKSGAISPAYTNIALGLQWTPNSWFDINIAPLTGGFTICTNELLRSSYGMKLACAEDDAAYQAAVAAGNPLGSFYKSALFQFGAQVKTNLKFSINDVLKYETQAVIFTDYLSEPYVRINWDNSIDWQLSRLVKLSFKTWMISDPNVKITETLADSTTKDVPRGAQWKEFLSFNFTYTFANKK